MTATTGSTGSDLARHNVAGRHFASILRQLPVPYYIKVQFGYVDDVGILNPAAVQHVEDEKFRLTVTLGQIHILDDLHHVHTGRERQPVT